MVAGTLVMALAAVVVLAGTMVNETTHGGLAEGLGMGHHHMGDYGGYHCADPGDADWERHEAHMHPGGSGGAAHCGDGHMGAGHRGMWV